MQVTNNTFKKKIIIYVNKLTIMSCAICLDKKNSTFAVIPCNHEFCDKCIFNWLEQHQTCPLCRRKADKTMMRKCRYSYFGSDSGLFALATVIGAT